MMGHLNSISVSGVGNLDKNVPKIQMPGGCPGGGGVFKLRFDRYINSVLIVLHHNTFNFPSGYLSRHYFTYLA